MAFSSICVSVVLAAIVSYRTYAVTIDDNGGYAEVVVAVSPHLDSREIYDVLSKLEDTFVESSKLLHIATRNLSYFGQITFLLPFNISETFAGKDVTFQTRSPDIEVLPQGLFQNNPYTIQHAGCGQPGRQINMPVSFLNEYDINTRAKAMVHEWAHYRFGVFDEHGFFGDELYPLVYTVPGKNDSLTVSGCTNKVAAYKFVNESGQRCDKSIDKCFPEADEHDSKIISSMMHKPFFPQVNQFCDGGQLAHDRNAPTKQNALCKERSTWEVILQSKDFARRTFQTKETDTSPKFKYAIEPHPQVIVAIESTDNMAVNERMDILKNALTYFLLYDIPKHAKLGLTDLNADGPLPELVDFMSGNSFQRVFELLPEAYGKSPVCVHCGIMRASRVLRKENGGGSIILATTEDIFVNQVKIMQKILLEGSIKLFVLYFQANKKQPPLLESLAVSTGGRLFNIPEESKHSETLSPLTVLYEAFRSVYESLSWMNKNIALIDQKVFSENLTDNFLSFTTDKTVDNLKVILTGPNFYTRPPVVRSTVVLQNENATYSVGHEAFSYRMKIPAYVFEIKDPQAGLWNLTFERKKGYSNQLTLIVRGGRSAHDDGIHVRSWLSSHMVSSNQAHFIYAEAFYGIHPLTNAGVTAVFHHHVTHKEFEIKLFDSGEGDPDITRYDGIYTRYITGLQYAGYYTVTVKVHRGMLNTTNNPQEKTRQCCGSKMPLFEENRNEPFTRTIVVGTFYFESNFSSKKLPPRRIVDLHITDSAVSMQGMRLYNVQWTAPGDDFDSGTVHAYEVKLFGAREDALSNFDTSQLLVIDYTRTYGPLLQPEPAGSLQTVIIELKNLTDGTYFLAVRATDSDSNHADVSNVVQLYYTQPVTTSPDIATATLYPVTVETESVSRETDKSVGEGLSAADMNVVIGLTCAGLVMLVLAGLFLFFCLPRLRKPEVETTSRPQPNRDPKNVVYVSSVSASQHQNSMRRHQNSMRRHQNSNGNETSCSSSTTVLQNQCDSAQTASHIYSIGNSAYDSDSLYAAPYSNHQSHDSINYPFNPAYTSSISSSHSIQHRLRTDV